MAFNYQLVHDSRGWLFGLGCRVSVLCDVSWALICTCGQLVAPWSHISDAWLATDKGNGSNQATWYSPSDKLAWACSHGSDCTILKTAGEGKAQHANIFLDLCLCHDHQYSASQGQIQK